MEISSVLSSAYVKNSGKTTSQAESTMEVKELSDAEKLENFKKEIWGEINSFPWNKSMNISIQITDGAFKRMMKDPDFKDRMLSVIQKESIAAKPPGNASLTWIDESGYKGFSYIDNNAGLIAFKAHSNHKDTFFVRKAKNKDDLNEIWLKQQQKRQEQRELLDEKIVKQEQERNRLLKSWNNEKLLAKASNAYEINVLTETMADGVSLLGGQRM